MAILQRVKKERLKAKKHFKFTGIAFSVSIVSFIIFGVISDTKTETDNAVANEEAVNESASKVAEPEETEEKVAREQKENEGKATAEQKAKEEAEVKVRAEEKAKAKPVVASTWQDKVKEVASMEGTAGEKFDAISLYAMDYPVTKEEKNTFLADIIAEYKEGRYVADLTNDEYMLANLFKSQAIDEFYDDKDVNAEQDFAFDFWQNSKYTYRGVDAIDSDAVRANERQMDKALKKIK